MEDICPKKLGQSWKLSQHFGCTKTTSFKPKAMAQMNMFEVSAEEMNIELHRQVEELRKFQKYELSNSSQQTRLYSLFENSNKYEMATPKRAVTLRT